MAGSYCGATVTAIVHETPKDLSYPYACRLCGDLTKVPPLQFGRNPTKTLPIDVGLCFAHWDEWRTAEAKTKAEAPERKTRWVKPAPSPLRLTV